MYFEERMGPVIESWILAPPQGIAENHQHLLLHRCFSIMLEDDAAFDAAARTLHSVVLQSCRLEKVMAKHNVPRPEYLYGPLKAGDVHALQAAPVSTAQVTLIEVGEVTLEVSDLGLNATSSGKERGCEPQCARSSPCR